MSGDSLGYILYHGLYQAYLRMALESLEKGDFATYIRLFNTAIEHYKLIPNSNSSVAKKRR